MVEPTKPDLSRQFPTLHMSLSCKVHRVGFTLVKQDFGDADPEYNARIKYSESVRNRDRIARLATKYADAMTTAFCATVESEHPVGRLRCGRKLFLHTQQETAMCTILALQGCA